MDLMRPQPYLISTKPMATVIVALRNLLSDLPEDADQGVIGHALKCTTVDLLVCLYITFFCSQSNND